MVTKKLVVLNISLIIIIPVFIIIGLQLNKVGIKKFTKIEKILEESFFTVAFFNKITQSIDGREVAFAEKTSYCMYSKNNPYPLHVITSFYDTESENWKNMDFNIRFSQRVKDNTFIGYNKGLKYYKVKTDKNLEFLVGIKLGDHGLFEQLDIVISLTQGWTVAKLTI